MVQDDVKRPLNCPAAAVNTFTYHSMGHKAWKFHNGISSDTTVIMDDKLTTVTGHKRSANGRIMSTQDSNGCRKRLTRTLSVGSVCSTSESECSSQSSMGSPDAEDLAKEFLVCPVSPVKSDSSCELLIETPLNEENTQHQTFKAKILPSPNFSLAGLVKVLSNKGNFNGNEIEIIQNNKGIKPLNELIYLL